MFVRAPYCVLHADADGSLADARARLGRRSRTNTARGRSVLRRVGTRAVGSDQPLQFGDISRLDQVRMETGGEARVTDVRVRIATQGDQAELCRRKPLAETFSTMWRTRP